MRRFLPTLLMAFTFAAGCSDEAQFSFDALPLEQTPANTEFTVNAMPGQLVIAGYFQTCTVSDLRPILKRSGSDLSIIVTEHGCRTEPGAQKLWMYRVIWTGLGSNKLYHLRIEHRGEAGQGDAVVYDEAIALP